jgi:hypothetical protein
LNASEVVGCITKKAFLAVLHALTTPCLGVTDAQIVPRIARGARNLVLCNTSLAILVATNTAVRLVDWKLVRRTNPHTYLPHIMAVSRSTSRAFMTIGPNAHQAIFRTRFTIVPISKGALVAWSKASIDPELLLVVTLNTMPRFIMIEEVTLLAIPMTLSLTPSLGVAVDQHHK